MHSSRVLVSFSRLLLLFRVFCVSIQILSIFFCCCSNSVRKCHWLFDRGSTESVDCLGSIIIFIILILPIQERGIFSTCLCHLWFLSSISYSFLSNRSFASLVRFIPMYFVLFDVIVNEIVFLISLSDFLLLVYRMQEALVW